MALPIRGYKFDWQDVEWLTVVIRGPVGVYLLHCRPQTSRSAPHCVRIAGKPEANGSSVGFVPTNALVLTALANFRVVGDSKIIQLGIVRISTGKSYLGAANQTCPVN